MSKIFIRNSCLMKLKSKRERESFWSYPHKMLSQEPMIVCSCYRMSPDNNVRPFNWRCQPYRNSPGNCWRVQSMSTCSQRVQFCIKALREPTHSREPLKSWKSSSTKAHEGQNTAIFYARFWTEVFSELNPTVSVWVERKQEVINGALNLLREGSN